MTGHRERLRLQFVKLNVFETFLSFTHSVIHVVLALLSPTVWALVFGYLLSTAVGVVGSYFLLKDVKQRFHVSRKFLWQILHFGKWLFLASLALFLATNFDRLYLAKVVPLEIIGIYGIARSISELASSLVMRLANILLFPFVASHSHVPRQEFRQQLSRPRAKFLALAAVVFAALVSTSDLAIKLLYDERYHAASWMLPVLIIGSWFSMLVNINESTLLGFGKPSYSALSNGCKFAFLLLGLPLSVTMYGLVGGLLIVASADVFRYLPVLIGQRRENFSFGLQDLCLTLLLFSLIGSFEWLRWVLGFASSLDVPI